MSSENQHCHAKFTKLGSLASLARRAIEIAWLCGNQGARFVYCPDYRPGAKGQMSNLQQKGWGACFPALLVLIAGVIASQPGCAAQNTIKTEAGTLKVETVAEGLEHPWGG